MRSPSVASRRRHKMLLEVLRKEAGASKPVAKLTRADIDAVLAERRARGCADSSLNAYKGTFRLFADFCVSSGYTKTNVAAHLKNVKTVTSRSKRKPVTAAQLRKMMEIAGESVTPGIGPY